jgi:RNA polymerase-binding transcription factor DksA
MKAGVQAGRDWAWHYRTLSRLRDLLISERLARSEALRHPIERGGEDLIDVATGQSEHAELVAELRIEEAELAQVEAALNRIRDGRYGVCELTGEPISPERLRVIPWTRFSVAAAKRLERANGSER